MRAQRLSSTFIERARATERAARELGGRSPQRDWMLTVLSPFLNTRSARHPDARREFRTFVSPDQLETENQDVFADRAPNSVIDARSARFLAESEGSRTIRHRRTIVVVEARMFNQVGYMGAMTGFALEDQWGPITQRLAGARYDGTFGMPTPPNLAPFGGAGNELRRPLPNDLARDFQRCWRQQVYEGTGENSRHSRSARSTCHVRLAVVLRNPTEKQCLVSCASTLLKSPHSAATRRHRTKTTTVGAAKNSLSCPTSCRSRIDFVCSRLANRYDGLGELAAANHLARSKPGVRPASPLRKRRHRGLARLSALGKPASSDHCPPAPSITAPPASTAVTTRSSNSSAFRLRRTRGIAARPRPRRATPHDRERQCRVRPDTNAPIIFEVQPGAVVEVAQLVAGGEGRMVVVERQLVGFIRVTALERNSGAPTLGAASPVGVAAACFHPPGWPLIIPGPVSIDLNERRRLCPRGSLRATCCSWPTWTVTRQ